MPRRRRRRCGVFRKKVKRSINVIARSRRVWRRRLLCARETQEHSRTQDWCRVKLTTTSHNDRHHHHHRRHHRHNHSRSLYEPPTPARRSFHSLSPPNTQPLRPFLPSASPSALRIRGPHTRTRRKCVAISRNRSTRRRRASSRDDGLLWHSTQRAFYIKCLCRDVPPPIVRSFWSSACAFVSEKPFPILRLIVKNAYKNMFL